MRYYVPDTDFSPERTWELASWCRAWAADFVIREMGIQGKPDPVVDAAEKRLAPYSLGEAVRPRTVVYGGHADAELSTCWTLTADASRSCAPYLQGACSRRHRTVTMAGSTGAKYEI